MQMFSGRYSLNELEDVLGNFTHARMVPVPLILDQSQRRLVAIGYGWACGCDARGAATPAWWTTCLFSPCASHRHFFEPRPIGELPPQYSGGMLVERSIATMQPGQILLANELFWEPNAQTPRASPSESFSDLRVCVYTHVRPYDSQRRI